MTMPKAPPGTAPLDLSTDVEAHLLDALARAFEAGLPVGEAQAQLVAMVAPEFVAEAHERWLGRTARMVCPDCREMVPVEGGKICSHGPGAGQFFCPGSGRPALSLVAVDTQQFERLRGAAEAPSDN